MNATGSSEPEDCPAGTRSSTAASYCKICDVGSWSDARASECKLCDAGYSSDARGASECSACPAGTYKGAGEGPCLDCPAATYTDQPGRSECLLAKPGTYVSEPGSSEATNCSARAWTKISHWTGPWRLGRFDARGAAAHSSETKAASVRAGGHVLVDGRVVLQGLRRRELQRRRRLRMQALRRPAWTSKADRVDAAAWIVRGPRRTICVLVAASMRPGPQR